MPEFDFGVSLASLLPHSINSQIFRGSPTRVAARLIDECGYRFFQTLPSRGITGYEWFCNPEWSWYKEDAWNAVDNIFQALLGQDGEEMMPANLIDWAVFPDSYKVDEVLERLSGRHVCHDFGQDWESRLVEINPEIRLTPYELAYKAWSEGYGLCLDTEHLFGKPHYYDPWFDDPHPLGQTRQDRIANIDVFAPYVQLVHLKGVDGIHQQVIERLLRSPRLQPRIGVVAEFKPDPRMSENQAITRAGCFLASTTHLFLRN